jgi:hypothetical protein
MNLRRISGSKLKVPIKNKISKFLLGMILLKIVLLIIGKIQQVKESSWIQNFDKSQENKKKTLKMRMD